MSALFTPGFYPAGARFHTADTREWVVLKNVTLKTAPARASAYVKLAPVVDPKDALIAQLKAQILALTARLMTFETPYIFQEGPVVVPPVVVPPVVKTGPIPLDAGRTYQTGSFNADGFAILAQPYAEGDTVEQPAQPPFGYKSLRANNTLTWLLPNNNALVRQFGVYSGQGNPPVPGKFYLVPVDGSERVLVLTFTGGYNSFIKGVIPTGGIRAKAIEYDADTVWNGQNGDNFGYTTLTPLRILPVGDYSDHVTAVPVLSKPTMKPPGSGMQWYYYTSPETNQPSVLTPEKKARIAPYSVDRVFVRFEWVRHRNLAGNTPIQSWYNPMLGGANLKDILADGKANGRRTLVCLTNNLPEFTATYPQDYGWAPERNVTPFGADKLALATWVTVAGEFYQFAAFAGNGNVAVGDVNQSTSPYADFVGEPVHQRLVNQNLTDWVEKFNERNADYFGPDVLLTGQEDAVAFHMCLDGAGGQFPKCGVRAADPNFELVPGATYNADERWWRAFLTKLYALRKDLPKRNGRWDSGVKTCNVHYYFTAEDGNGMAPENSPFWNNLRRLQELFAEFNCPVQFLLSETGYSKSTNTQVPHRALPTAGKTSAQRARDFIVRIQALAEAHGLDVVINYDLLDHLSDAEYPGYLSANLFWDLTCGQFDRPEHAAISQMGQFQGYAFDAVVQNPSRDPALAYVYRYTKPGAPALYKVWSGTEADATRPFTLALPGKTSLVRHRFQDTGTATAQTTLAIVGTYTGIADETPAYYLAN